MHVESISSEVGIDVSQDVLEVSIDGVKVFKAGNDESGAAQLVSILEPGSRVHLEATGGYERLVRHALLTAGFSVQLHNPRKVRRMADALGFTAKTDAQDAKALAAVGPLIKTKPAKSAVQEQLCDISRTIKSLTDEATRNKKRMQKPGMPKACIESLQSVNKAIAKQKLKLEKAYIALLSDSELKSRHQLATSVPGIGPTTARVLACELPANLNDYRPKQFASYAGMAPIDDSSGKRNGPRHIRKGNVHIKAAMYMPAVCAMAHCAWAKKLYSRLRSEGRTHDQAIIAIMRKMLVLAVAVIQRGTAFEAVPPERKIKFE